MTPIEMSDGNGRVAFIKKQIGDAIVRAEASKSEECVCAVHAEGVDFQVLTVRVAEMVLDEMLDFKQEFGRWKRDDFKELQGTVEGFVDQRKFVTWLWKICGVLFGTSSLAGLVLLVLNIARLVGEN